MKTTFPGKCVHPKVSIAALANFCVFSIAVFFGGCSQNSDTPQSPPREKVLIKGSNTVGEELAPRLIAEYRKDHPKVGIDIETKGSESGFWGLIAGACDIAASSRGMIKDEQ